MSGYSSDAHQWHGTYDHSHTYFDAAVQNIWEKNGNTEQKRTARIRVQNNLHADDNFRTHVNTFDCEEPNQERSRREWVQALRQGDRIQLYAIAMYPGWLNFVQEVRITIRYHESAAGEETGDGSTEELPEKFRKLKVVRQNPRDSPLSHQPKVVIYHQSFHTKSGMLTSLRPLVWEKTGITAVILSSFRVELDYKETEIPSQQHGGNGSAVMYLNEYMIDDPDLEDMWIDIDYLQREGVRVIGMLSMRGNHNESSDDRTWLGSCDDLTFERLYKVVHDLVFSRRLDGINLDMDVPQNQVNTERTSASLHGVIRLIDSLHADFGLDFIIAMTASAEALLGIDTNQQGNSIDYRKLELQRGHLISWYNVQIFSSCRYGDDQLDETGDPSPILVHDLNLYIRLIGHDVYRAHKILVALSTTPDAVSETLGDRGAYVNLYLFGRLLELLRWSYGPLDFGGVAGWEYSQASELTRAGHSRGIGMPWDWIKEAKAILESVFPGRG